MTPRLLALSALLFWAAAVPADKPADKAKRVAVGPGVTLEIDGDARRVLVSSKVILRKGLMEGLLTRAGKKEHEYLLAADIDARHVHTALELATAKAGAPAKFVPKFVPATGTKVAIAVRYRKAGATVTEPAAKWFKDAATGKPVAPEWVFGGSRFGPNPEGDNLPKYYMANHGDIVCVCNTELAMLDVPTRSPKNPKLRLYEADESSIPPVGTEVEVIMEPERAKGRR